MRELLISTIKPYKVLIGAGSLRNLAQYLDSLDKPPRAVVIVTDSNVYPLYGKLAQQSLAGFKTHIIKVPAGEEHKTPETVLTILRVMAQQELSRDDIVVALGGGVIGDMAGFAAAVYQRSIRFIQCPTTLLSAVDASVGGKTAVDLPEGKNLIGAFHQPSLVVCDTDTFKTLPDSRISDGSAEIIKHGIIADETLFDAMKSLSWHDRLESIVARNVEIKRSFVMGDVHDKGKRQMLNFGHTFGHAIEAGSNYTLTHGQAVAIGMVMETRAARRLGLCDTDEKTLIDVLRRNGLPTEYDLGAETIRNYMLHDKKKQSSGIMIMVPTRIGEARLEHLALEHVNEYIEAGKP